MSCIPNISVLICSHNPRRDFLQQTLNALQVQSLAKEHWELLLVDNSSNQPLSGYWDISWHPNARHIHENELGLTPARLRGISESCAELIIFVDDDNVLDSKYLEKALEIEKTWPQLGTWGGSITGGFEETPEEWTKRYWNWLAIRELKNDLWSNVISESAALPYGAGMCIRREVADYYCKQARASRVGLKLDRSGESLWGGGDADMSYTAIEMGYGNGVFKSLNMMHLMPKERLSESYLLKLIQDMTCSHHVLNYRRGIRPPSTSRSQELLARYQRFFISPRERRILDARKKGLNTAIKIISDLEKSGAS
jgi:glycosyltransferase involved in cell wall biosynthesis